MNAIARGPSTWRRATSHRSAGSRLRGTSRANGKSNGRSCFSILADARGRAVVARKQRYVVVPRPKLPSLLKMTPGDTMIAYAYDTDADRVGRVVKMSEALFTDSIVVRKPYR